MTEIKRCPFCGADVCELIPYHNTNEHYQVHCLQCMTLGPVWPTEVAAITDWNITASIVLKFYERDEEETVTNKTSM